MKYLINTEEQTLIVESEDGPVTEGLFTEAAFEKISQEWVRIGWSLGYYSAFTWMGQQILQLPQDLIRLQETIFVSRPDLIIETGVYKGGSLLYYATVCHALGKGRIIGVDVSIPLEVRSAIQEHPLGGLISLIEGSSTSVDVLETIRTNLRSGENVMVVLDSAHTHDHVRRELELYSPLVTAGSFLVVADGVMQLLVDVPGGDAGWLADNPALAAREFLAAHPEFVACSPAGLGSHGNLTASNTYFREGWLQRIR